MSVIGLPSTGCDFGQSNSNILLTFRLPNRTTCFLLFEHFRLLLTLNTAVGGGGVGGGD